jgi:NAD+ kinase
MLEVSVTRGGAKIMQGSCLNEVVISSAGIAKLIHLQVFLNLATATTDLATNLATQKSAPENLATNLATQKSAAENLATNLATNMIALGAYRCDALIVSTPTGSTAHSLAAGGPILAPELEAIALNPICPFTLSHRPMVLPAEEVLTIEVEKETGASGTILTVDGQVTEKLKPADKVCIKKALWQCLLITPSSFSFYEALKTKLAWTGGGTGVGAREEGRGRF